jgi:hypothetical protein
MSNAKKGEVDRASDRRSPTKKGNAEKIGCGACGASFDVRGVRATYVDEARFRRGAVVDADIVLVTGDHGSAWACRTCIAATVDRDDRYHAVLRAVHVQQIRGHQLGRVRDGVTRHAIEACLAAGDAAAIKTAWDLIAEAVPEGANP